MKIYKALTWQWVNTESVSGCVTMVKGVGRMSCGPLGCSDWRGAVPGYKHLNRQGTNYSNQYSPQKVKKWQFVMICCQEKFLLKSNSAPHSLVSQNQIYCSLSNKEDSISPFEILARGPFLSPAAPPSQKA